MYHHTYFKSYRKRLIILNWNPYNYNHIYYVEGMIIINRQNIVPKHVFIDGAISIVYGKV